VKPNVKAWIGDVSEALKRLTHKDLIQIMHAHNNDDKLEVGDVVCAIIEREVKTPSDPAPLDEVRGGRRVISRSWL
jgi:hypothetical protein